MSEGDGSAAEMAGRISRRSLIGRAAAVVGTTAAGSMLLPRAPGLLAPAAEALASGMPLEVIELTPDDLSLAPQRFSGMGSGGVLALGFNWGFMQDNPSAPNAPVPIRHFRDFTAAAARGKVFSRLSNEVTGHATPLHCSRLTGSSPAPYMTVQGDPTGMTNDSVTYEASFPGATGYQYNWSTKHTKIVESDVLDVTLDHFPWALCVNPSSVSSNAFAVSPWFVQFGVAHGIYDGKPVRYLGGTERLFANGLQAIASDPDLFFAGAYFVGELSDGSHEAAFVLVLFKDNRNGTSTAIDSMGFYVKEHLPGVGPGARRKRKRRRREKQLSRREQPATAAVGAADAAVGAARASPGTPTSRLSPPARYTASSTTRSSTLRTRRWSRGRCTGSAERRSTSSPSTALRGATVQLVTAAVSPARVRARPTVHGAKPTPIAAST